MAKFVLMLAMQLMSLTVSAQLFQNPFASKTSAMQGQLEKSLISLEGLEPVAGSESRYRELSSEVERQLDASRAACSESPQGNVRQQCFRELLGYHRRYLEKSFEFKRAFLKRLHEEQQLALEEARQEALKNLAGSF